MHKNTSLLLVQAATFLQNSMWQCSGPWVLTFSDQLKRISSRTLCRILCAFSNFHAFTSPLFTGRLVFNSSRSETDMACSFCNVSAVISNFLDCRCHFKAATWVSISFSLGSSTKGVRYRGSPGLAREIALLMRVICQIMYLLC